MNVSNFVALVYFNFTIIFQMISFLILVFLLNKFLYKPLLKFLDKRAETIKNTLDRTRKAEQGAKAELERIKKEYDDARRDSYKIREQAKEIAGKEKENIIANAQKEAEFVVDKAKKGIEQKVAQIKEDLRRKVGELAVNIAEKLLRTSLSEKQKKEATSIYVHETEEL